MSQREKIIEQLKQNGLVSRNWALANYISRLGAIMNDLKGEGWEFWGEYVDKNGGRDYVYRLIKQPSSVVMPVSQPKQPAMFRLYSL